MSLLHTSAAVLIASAFATAAAQSHSPVASAGSQVPPTARPPAASTALPNLPKGASGPGISPLVSGGNDSCGSASLILGTGPYTGDNLASTTDGLPASCTPDGNDVWYRWIAPVTGLTTVNLCNAGTTYDTVLTVSTGACPGVEIACDDDAGCGTTSLLAFPAIEGSAYLIRISGFAGAMGTFEMDLTLPTQTGSDTCATPDPVAGPGPHAFDLVGATTGVEGQANANCLFSGTMGISNDRWFTWTAPESGPTTVATCLQTGIDSKIAIYDGAGCPGAAALACNDDACASLQTSVVFPAVKGQNYMIQLGNFPTAAPGAGTFTITGPQPANACSYDDGISETSVGMGGFGGGENAYIQSFGAPGAFSFVRSISIAFGTPAIPGASPPLGTLVRCSVFDDPNDDGDPSDMVFLRTVSSAIHGFDGDVLAASAFSPPVPVGGAYFAVVSVQSGPGDFSAAFDTTTPSGGNSWYAGTMASGINYDDLPASFFYGTMIALGADGEYLLRVDCESAFNQLCFPGTGGVIPCPCGQPPNPVGGCANHGAGSTTGAVLAASGTPFVTADTVLLTTSNHRSPAAGVLNVFFSFDPGAVTLGAPNGAGVRCTGGGTLRRLYTVQVFGGSIAKPGMGDLSVSAKSATFPGHAISPPETRYYFNAYRDGQAAVPCGNPLSTVNVTNMASVSWVL